MIWNTYSKDGMSASIDTDIKDILSSVNSIADNHLISDQLKQKREDIDDSINCRKLFVSSLPYDVTEEELKSHFGTVGTALSVTFVRDQATGLATGQGFVLMSDSNEAQRAITELSSGLFMGRRIYIGRIRHYRAELLAEISLMLAELKLKCTDYPAALIFAHDAFERFKLLGRTQEQKYKKSMIECLDTYIQAFLGAEKDNLGDSAERAQQEIAVILEQAYAFQRIVPRDLKQIASLDIFDSFDDLRKKYLSEEPTSLSDFFARNHSFIFALNLPERDKQKAEWVQNIHEFCRSVEGLSPRIPSESRNALSRDQLSQLSELKRQGAHDKILDILLPFSEQGKDALLNPLDTDFTFEKPYRPPVTRNVKVRHLCTVAMSQYSLNNNSGALLTLEAVLEHDAMNMIVREWTAYLKALLGHYDRANIDYGIFRARKMVGDDVLWNMICLRYKQGNYEEAFTLLSQVTVTRSETLRRILGLALLAKKNSYLTDKLLISNDLNSLALGYRLAFENFDNNKCQLYYDKILRLGQVLIDDFQLFPEDEPLDLEDVDKSLAYIVRHELYDIGINHFKVRINKKQHGAHIYNALASLYELLPSGVGIPDAFRTYTASFNYIVGTAASAALKHSILISLLDFCSRHHMNTEGLKFATDHQRLLDIDEYSQYFETFSKISPPAEIKKPVKTQTGAPSGDEYEPVSVDSEVTKAREEIVFINSKIADIVSCGQVKGRRDVLINYCENIRKGYHEQDGYKIASHVNKIVDLLCLFSEKQKAQDPAKILEESLVLHSELKEIFKKSPDLERKLILIKRLGTCIGREQQELHMAPEPVINLHNTSFSESSKRSSLVIEVTNPSGQIIKDVNLELIFKHGVLEFLTDRTASIGELLPNDSEVLVFPFHKTKDGYEETVYLSYQFMFRDIQYPPKPIEFSLRQVPFKAIPQRYIYGRELTPDDQKNFHGRDEDLQNLIGCFPPTGQGRFIFLDGMRRVGKSSIINFLLPRLPASFCSAKISMDEKFTQLGTASFLFDICERMASKLANNGPMAFPLDKGDFAADPERAFKACIEAFKSTYPDKEILLIIDEFQDVVKAIREKEEESKPGLDEFVLNLMRHYVDNGDFHILCTGSLRFSHLGRYRKHRFFTSLNKLFPISFLTETATADALQIPVKDDGIVYTGKAIKKVWSMTRGYSEFVQKIGDLCREELNKEDRKVVAPQDVVFSAQELIKNDLNFQWWWDEKYLASAEETLMRKYIELPDSLEKGATIDSLRSALRHMGDDFNVALKNLLDQQILSLQGTRYIIFAELLKLWLPEWLKTRNTGLALPVNTWVLAVDHENLVNTLYDVYRERTGEGIMPENIIEHAISKIAAECESYGQVIDYIAVACFQYAKYLKDYPIYKRVKNKFRCEDPVLTGKEASDEEIKRAINNKLEDELSEIGRKTAIKNVMIVSGDHYFQSVLINLRRQGRRVLIRGFERNTRDDFKKEAGKDYRCLEEIIGVDQLFKKKRQ